MLTVLACMVWHNCVQLIRPSDVKKSRVADDGESLEIASRSDTRGSESRTGDIRSGCENIAADADGCARSQQPARRLANCL